MNFQNDTTYQLVAASQAKVCAVVDSMRAEGVTATDAFAKGKRVRCERKVKVFLIRHNGVVISKMAYVGITAQGNAYLYL